MNKQPDVSGFDGSPPAESTFVIPALASPFELPVPAEATTVAKTLADKPTANDQSAKESEGRSNTSSEEDTNCSVPASDDSQVPAPNESQAEKTDAPEIRSLEDCEPKFIEFANECDTVEAYLRRAFREICKAHRVVGFGFRGRSGANSISDFASVPEFRDAEKEQLRSLLSQVLLSCRGEQGTFLTGVETIGPHSLSLVTIGFEQSHIELVGTLSFALVDASPESNSSSNATTLENRAAKLSVSVYQMLAHTLDLVAADAPVGSKSATAAKTDEQVDKNVDNAGSTQHRELELTARTSRYSGPREFAFALANSLAQRFQCQEVSCGVRTGDSIQIQAISGKDSFKASSPGVVDIQQAMEETLDAGCLVAYQAHGQTARHNSMPVHTQWANSTRSAVCSVPMMAGEDCVGVVSLRRDGDVGFSEAELSELDDLIKPFGPAVELSKRGSRSLAEHAKASASDSWIAVRRPKTRTGKIARLVALVGLIVFIFGWLPFRPTTPCAVVPANMTQTLAPFDMQLAEVLVQSGDRVRKGQALARFDTRQLELERASLASRRAQASVDVRAALSAGDPASASLASAHATALQAELDAIDEKIALCTITAPSDGMVVDAELGQKLGQVFPQGEKVLTFAPMDAFELEIRVPESNARFISVGMSGQFASVADPSQQFAYTVQSVSGSAELIDGRNVFVAKAALDDASEHFRHGVEGYAKTHAGWRPIPWLAFHRVYEYAKSSFWL